MSNLFKDLCRIAYAGYVPKEQLDKMLEMDLSKVTDMEFDGIDHKDYPDYSDAYCCGAMYNGKKMTDDELDELNTEHSDFVYEKLWDYLH